MGKISGDYIARRRKAEKLAALQASMGEHQVEELNGEHLTCKIELREGQNLYHIIETHEYWTVSACNQEKMLRRLVLKRGGSLKNVECIKCLEIAQRRLGLKEK